MGASTSSISGGLPYSQSAATSVSCAMKVIDHVKKEKEPKHKKNKKEKKSKNNI